jgi:carnitine O-acetyltransferase
MQFKQSYDDKTLSPDMAKTPLCMEQYQFMFSTRIPAPIEDQTQLSTGDYCIVMRNNRFFKVNTNQITQQLVYDIDWIYKNATEPCLSIGILTTENRDKWNGIREILMKDAENLKNLETIQNSLFVICLDSETPITTEQKSRAYWHGNGHNRFFDKSLQFILHDNGTMGFCGEHS